MTTHTTPTQERTPTDDGRLVLALKALSAQASNAAFYLEHRDDPAYIALLADAGTTADRRTAECIQHLRYFEGDVDDLLARRDTTTTSVGATPEIAT